MKVVSRLNRSVVLSRSAADDRDLAILRERDKGVSIRTIARTLGLTDQVVTSRLEDILRDDAEEEGKPIAPLVQLAKPVTEPGAKVCLFPGCGRALSYRTTAGVCQGHNHQKPYCQCSKCRGEVAA